MTDSTQADALPPEYDRGYVVGYNKALADVAEWAGIQVADIRPAEQALIDAALAWVTGDPMGHGKVWDAAIDLLAYREARGDA